MDCKQIQCKESKTNSLIILTSCWKRKIEQEKVHYNNCTFVLTLDCLFLRWNIFCKKNHFWPNKNRFVQIRAEFLTFYTQNSSYGFDSLLIMGTNINYMAQPMDVIQLIYHITIKYKKLKQYLLLYSVYNTIIMDCIDFIWISLILPCNFGLQGLPKHST